MNPQEQIKILNDRLVKLEQIVNFFVKPDRYLFQRDIDFLNAHIGRAATSKLGFYGATPIVQQSSTGETTGFTAGAGGTTVKDVSTFTGNNGSTAYTILDVVKHLKNYGLLLK